MKGIPRTKGVLIVPGVSLESDKIVKSLRFTFHFIIRGAYGIIRNDPGRFPGVR